MFTLCNDIDKTEFDESILLVILSKFKLTSLRICELDEYVYENIFMPLLQLPSIQENLEHFETNERDIFECSSIFELLVEFKRIKTVKIFIDYYNKDIIERLKQKIQKFKKELREKHSEIEISIGNVNF